MFAGPQLSSCRCSYVPVLADLIYIIIWDYFTGTGEYYPLTENVSSALISLIQVGVWYL